MGHGSLDSKNLRIGAQNLTKHLDYFSWLLEKHTFLAGESMTLADLTLAAHLSCLDYFGAVPWHKYDIVKEWYSLIKSRPSFKPLLQDTIPGLTPHPGYKNLDF